MVLRGEDQDHAGIVVDDLPTAMDHLTAVAGYRWGRMFDGKVSVVFGDGTASTVDMRFVSSTTQPRVELIEQIPGTPWMPAGGGAIHHLGYWSDDVVADSADLVEQGMPVEVAEQGSGGAPSWAYHRGPVGPRIELLDRSLRTFVSDASEALGASNRPRPTD